MIRRPPGAVVAALLIGLLWAPARAAGEADPYYTLIYDFEVAWICGLADHGLYQAYMSRRSALEAADRRDEAALTRQRIRAMAAAERELDNRGLGGHRQWCETEGRAGRRRIVEAAR